MFHRYSLKTTVAALCLSGIIGCLPVYAEDFWCGQDLNDDGFVDAEGETVQCTGLDNRLCPLGRQACVVNDNPPDCTTEKQPFSVFLGAQLATSLLLQYDLANGSWTSVFDFPFTNGLTGSVPAVDLASVCEDNNPGRLLATLPWDNPATPNSVLSTLDITHVIAPSCDNDLKGLIYLDYPDDVGWGKMGVELQFEAYVKTCEEQPSHLCPADEDVPCVENGTGSYECSLNACVDLDVTLPEDLDMDTSWLLDDAGRTAEGVCLGDEFIFNGRPMRCDLSGKSTGYQNCCINEGEIYQESTGGLAESTGQSKLLTSSFAATYAYATTYYQAIEAGYSTASASSLASSQAVVAFDPTTLVIAVVVALVVDYFTQACDATSMETSMFDASGFCYPLGTFCRERWTGIGCVQRSRGFCCFNSKMSKLMHEQGRTQLDSFGPGFGSVTNPECRGFTPEEFQAIDFSQIDFSSYYAELVPDFEVNMADDLATGASDYADRVQ